MAEDATLEQHVDELTARLMEVRRVKHQICNELMGVVGHSQLLEQQADLTDKARLRVSRIREHCRNLSDQAEELTRLCLLSTPKD